jgi:hypothetical protein
MKNPLLFLPWGAKFTPCGVQPAEMYLRTCPPVCLVDLSAVGGKNEMAENVDTDSHGRTLFGFNHEDTKNLIDFARLEC